MMGHWQAAKAWKLSQVTSSGHGGMRTTGDAGLITINTFAGWDYCGTGLSGHGPLPNSAKAGTLELNKAKTGISSSTYGSSNSDRSHFSSLTV